MRIIKDIAYNGYTECKLDMYLPEQDSFETIIWFHGGGLENGDKGAGERLSKDLVNAGYGFVSVDYRSYTGGARFPEFIYDAAESTVR